MICLDSYLTEARNPKTTNLDCMSALQLVAAMNSEDAKVAPAVAAVLPQVAKAVETAAQCIAAGGRLIYLGAGTSGRLGVLDAAECPPTFGVAPGLVVGLIAGGSAAMQTAVEGAEDSETLAGQDLAALGLTPQDFVVGLAASGRTPYVVHGLLYAKRLGCHTAAIACNPGSQIGQAAELAIEPQVGPEVLTGSTRLKAGTAQKMILNMISTGCMVRQGHAYENLMVNLQATNAKLKVRTENIVMQATGCERRAARDALGRADGQVKTAILMLLLRLPAGEARVKLHQHGGKIRCALQKECP